MQNPLKVVGCFIEYEGKILLLHRWPEKSEGNKWGLPAGKAELGESSIQAILREIMEETGYQTTEDKLEFIGEYPFTFPDKSVIFTTFRLRLENPFEVKINSYEHQNFQWITPLEASKLENLIHGLHDVLRFAKYI